MWDILKELSEAAKTLKLTIEINTPTETQKALFNVRKNFFTADGNSEGALWEKIHECVSVQNVDAWRWVSMFIGNRKSIMFFNPDEENASATFSSGQDIVEILGETHGFEFYLTNEEASYLICFNHHNYLIVCGEAKSWLQERGEAI